MKKIITIGEIVVEIMATEQGDGFLEPVPLIGPFPSGAPAIFIDQAGKLGQPCGMISRVGDDDFGRVNLSRLAADGVDISAISIDPEAATGSAFVRYRQDGNRDFVFNIKHSACGNIEIDSAARALINTADHLHVMGSSLFAPNLVAATHDAIADVKKRGGTVSFDPNLRVEMLKLPGMSEALSSILGRCDLFLPSGAELTLLTKSQDAAGAIEEILSLGVRAIVLKKGVGGAEYHDASSHISQTAYQAQEVDPTGAGDCFGATFVTCWLRDMPPGQALNYAAASGALAVSRRGPMEGSSAFADLDALILPQSTF